MTIENCPVMKMTPKYSIPKLTDEQWAYLSKYFKVTNITVQFPCRVED